MLDLTTLDYIYVGVIIVSTVWATIRGGVYETVATLSWVVAAFAARFVSPLCDRLLQILFDLPESTVATLVASYFIVFFVILMLVGFFNQRLREKIQNSMMKVTDRTLGIIFGIIRGIVIMGIVYWVALWYYSDAPRPAAWVENARTRPIMQLTALKLDEWFIPGEPSKLLARDMTGTQATQEIFNNLINPAVSDKSDNAVSDADTVDGAETGYKSSERTALEKQLLQIENATRAEEERAAADVDTDENATTKSTDDVSAEYGSADAPVTSD